MNDFTTILREHNLKATPQRIEIANALHLKGHMSLDELYGVMQNKFQSISLATIYKNIHLMLEKHFIAEVKVPHKKSVYEIAKATHSHLICNRCGAIEDIELDMQSVLAELSTKSDFCVEEAHLVLSGLCGKCRE